MRVLAGCSLGGLGHLTPIVAAARAMGRLGHQTVVLVPPSLADAAAATGIQFRVGEEPPRSVINALWSRVRAGPAETVAGLLDRELFADRCTAAMLPAARAVRDDWRPQLVVRESCEYATAAVAHQSAIPQIQVGISQSAIDYGVLTGVTATLEDHAAGLADAIAGSPYLSSFPASLDHSPWRETRRFRHPHAYDRTVSAPAPADGDPLVYVTFGTVLGHLPEAASVYRTALDAVATLPARVLLTVGRAVDPVQLGRIPENVRVERWVSHPEVFRHARLVVCHGGSGTVCGALAAGLPLVMCPLFADQAANGRLIERARAGVVVSAGERGRGGLARLGPAEVAPLRTAIESVLGDPALRAGARRIAAEIAVTPTLERTLADLLAA